MRQSTNLKIMRNHTKRERQYHSECIRQSRQSKGLKRAYRNISKLCPQTGSVLRRDKKRNCHFGEIRRYTLLKGSTLHNFFQATNLACWCLNLPIVSMQTLRSRNSCRVSLPINASLPQISPEHSADRSASNGLWCIVCRISIDQTVPPISAQWCTIQIPGETLRLE